jgi:hypothetical protein
VGQIDQGGIAVAVLTISQLSRKQRSTQFGYSTILLGIVLYCGLTVSASAQMNTCGMALQQLQMYVGRVNQTAQYEYYQGIPMRCRGNPMCGQAMLQQLNFWYAQQSNMVNNYYMQISAQCSSGPPTPLERRPDDTGSPRISERDVKTVQIDDEDRTVRIKIPSTPQGFVPQ